jgi:hypothetical protein
MHLTERLRAACTSDLEEEIFDLAAAEPSTSTGRIVQVVREVICFCDEWYASSCFTLSFAKSASFECQ